MDGKGVHILFTDGSQWHRNEKTDINTGGDTFSYSAFITLTAADLNLFSTKTVKKIRLYIFDESIEKDDADKFQENVKCIRNAK